MDRMRIIICVFFGWFVIIVYVSNYVIKIDSSSQNNQRWRKGTDDLEQQNARLKSLIATLRIARPGPSAKHEDIRRKLSNDLIEWWRYIKSQLSKSLGKSSKLTNFGEILREGESYYRTLNKDLKKLSEVDGADEWRKSEGEDLGRLIQKRLHALQNPVNCKTAKKLVCYLNKLCGFGCQLHHVTFCFIVAYATERVLILLSVGWEYSPRGWEEVFLPLSDSCTTYGHHKPVEWRLSKPDTQVITVDQVESIIPRLKQLPLAIPDDLASRLIRFHGNPIAWWVGQFVKYLFRPQPDVQRYIAETINRLGFTNPIIGLHVRRTDKINTEAAYHSIDEYMTHARVFYDVLENVTEQRVYIASDDPNVVTEARAKYPHVTFISDTGVSKSAGLKTRYSVSSLRGVILDIYLLSLTDHLVCTFSSQICRVAYELMQTRHGDASTYFNSLDDIYYFGGQNGHNVRAIQRHYPLTVAEIGLEVGDLIHIAGNHWDGFSKGKNLRTDRTGLFPSYKVQNIIETARFSIHEKRTINNTSNIIKR